jgi:hypothetical protein
MNINGYKWTISVIISRKNMGLSFAYLCIFRAFFRAVLKEPNLRFESAQMTSSKRLFDKLIKAL